MNIAEQHFDFKIKSDKIDSLSRRNLRPHEIDWLLNEAQNIIVKQRYGQTNVKRSGFESIQKRTEDLRTLVVKSPTTTQPGVAPVRNTSDVYEFLISDFEFPYYFLVRISAKITDGSCEKVINGTIMTQHDDLNRSLDLEFVKPDFNWGRILVLEGRSDQADESEGSIYVYTDGFEVMEIYPEYIKKPKNVWIGTYDSLDGRYIIGNPAVSSELPEHLHSEIVDIAVKEAVRIMENPNLFQLYQEKVMTHE